MHLSLAFIFLFLSMSPAHAVLGNGWNVVSLMSAISCNSDLNRNYFIPMFNEYYGPPIRQEGDAYWFKGKDEMYGSSIKEVFVSSKAPFHFVGVILDIKPDELVPKVESWRFVPTRLFKQPDNRWVGADGRSLVWHDGRYAKMFCIGVKDGK